MAIGLFLHYIVVVTINTLDFTETCNSVYYPATKCLDKLDHYECVCRQGHMWNGYSCIADAVDSRLAFNGNHVSSYIELDSKPFPRISELTISFWIRIWPKVDSSYHTILYYRTDDPLPVLLVSIVDNARLHVELLNHAYDVSDSLALNQWHHIAIAHRLVGSTGIKIMINGTLVVVLIPSRTSSQGKLKTQTTISGGGDFFVGQMIRPKNSTSLRSTDDFEFDNSRAFYGEIAFLNLWQKVLSDYELQQLTTDCHVQQQACGDAVTWMDFVNNIKKEIKIHWPSGIYELFANCPTQEWLRESCDTYCQKLEGPHCKNESQMSIIWPKVPAGQNATKQCPGNGKEGQLYRTCQRIEQIARWTQVNYDQCIHPIIKTINRELESITSDKEYILALRDKCAFLAEMTSMNLTATYLYSSIDLSLLIEQIERLTNILTSHFDSLAQWYSLSYEPFYLADVNATLSIHQYLVETISNLIDERYQLLWNETYPSGNYFIRLLISLQRLTSTLAQVLSNDCEQFPGCSFQTSTANIDQSIQIITRQQLKLFVFENTSTKTRISFAHTKKNTNTNRTTVNSEDKNNGSAWYSVSITSFRTAHLYIPNLRLGRVSKYDNLNNHIISIDVKLRKSISQSNRLSTLVPIDPGSVLITTGYLNYENISDTECVYLDTTSAFSSGQYQTTLTRQWRWHSSASVCTIVSSSKLDRATCSCSISNGTFAVTSDMFDPKWRAPESRLYLFGRFSYIGSFVHIAFALLTLIMLNYLRTHSSAAYIHKHYSFVLCCSQVVLLLAYNGIPLSNSILCRAVACTAHFFILSSYCWLMNEAFNLYIQITYSTHPAVAGASATLSEAASKYRFLGMGYVLPFCIVTLLASIKTKTYFMPTKLGLCFMDLDDWFKIYFIPITGIIFITIMVMIFSAKQHHESSYTKNEKANEVIVTYTGGIWSQLFLATVSWSLAILPYFYDETILRLLHGFFSGLQGGFLFLSFFLFNDEIRRHYRDRRRQLRRIQLMEVPYRNSVSESEGLRSSVVVPAVSPHLVVQTTTSLTTAPSTKGTSVASVVSSLLARNRASPARNCDYEEMKWTLRRKSSDDRQTSQEVIANKHALSKDAKDYRVTVV